MNGNKILIVEFRRIITKTGVCNTAIFHGCKKENFQMKKCDIFSYFCSNIDCGYSLEPPH